MSNDVTTYRIKVLLIGDPAVGKTSLINKYAGGSFEKDYKATIGCDLMTKNVSLNDNKDLVSMAIWDIAGHEKFQNFRLSFYKGATGALVVFDLTRYKTFTNIINWMKEMWSFTGRIPIVLLGNKVDLKDKRGVKSKDAKFFAEKVPCNYMETSAKAGDRVEEAFIEIAQKSIEYYTNKTKR